MYAYSPMEWLLFFYIYCFIGWCVESTYVSSCKKRFVNRGFMRGPFLPLYGSGAIMMLLVSMPYQDNLFLTYIAGVIGATVLEYVTGVGMETLFKVRYWDYSNQRFNFKGYICLGTSLAWGFLTIFMTRVIHKPIENIVLSVPVFFSTILVLLLTVIIAVDFTMSFRTALDLKNILIHMDKAKEELERMQKRLDVLIAVADNVKEEWAEGFDHKKEQLLESIDSRKQANASRMEELSGNIEATLSHLKKSIQEKPSIYKDSVRDEVSEMRGRFLLHMENRKQLRIKRDFNKRNMILGNPSMRSEKYNDFLEEIRAEIEKSHKK